MVMYIKVTKKIPKKKKGAPRSNITFQQKKKKKSNITFFLKSNKMYLNDRQR